MPAKKLVLYFRYIRKRSNMAVYERGQEKGREEDSGHKQRIGAARRYLPRVDFENMNFEQRRPPYNPRGTSEERNEGEPQQAGKRRDDL